MDPNLEHQYFTVLMSTYYKENPEYARQALKSIFNQTLLPNEVVLVEDGPLTDKLYEVIEEYRSKQPIIKIIQLKERKELGDALNIGLQHCSYNLIVRMDSDDINKPQRFERQVSFMTKHPEIDVMSAWIDEFNTTTGKIISVRKLPENNDEIKRFCKKRNPINHPSVIFKKNKVLDSGGYQHFYLFEDYYLWVRMIMNGCRFYNLQESLLNFRLSSNTFNRRGGLIYLRTENEFQRLLYKIKFISFPKMVINISIRSFVRILPNKLRGFLYLKYLR